MKNEIKEIIESAILSVADLNDGQAIEDAVFTHPEFCPTFGAFGDLTESDLVAATLTTLKDWYEEGFLRNKPAFLIA